MFFLGDFIFPCQLIGEGMKTTDMDVLARKRGIFHTGNS